MLCYFIAKIAVHLSTITRINARTAVPLLTVPHQEAMAWCNTG